MDPIPDKEQPDQKPPSRGTPGESAEDRQFWGADDDDPETADGELPPGEDDAENADPPEPLPGDDPLDDDLDEPADDLDEPAEDAAAPNDPPQPGDPDAAPKRRVSPSDAIWIGTLSVVLLGVAIWALTEFLSNVQTVGRPDEIDYPVKGERVTIAKIDTWWRKPDLDTDRVQLGTHLIPCASIVLKPGSGPARLRCFFQNDTGDYVGDPITLDVADGSFAESGEAKMVIHSTAGLKGEGEYNAYASTDVDFWSLLVFEGPPTEDGGDFKEIVRVPISPKRR